MKKVKYQNIKYKSDLKRENQFQKSIIQELKNMFKDSIIIKLPSGYIQGIPDLLILFKNKWAALECKRSRTSHVQPNQEYWVNKMNKMSFSRFIYPENKEEVLNELRKAFKS